MSHSLVSYGALRSRDKIYLFIAKIIEMKL